MSDLMIGIFEEILGSPRKHSESKCQIAFDCPECSAEKGMIDGDGKGKLEINYSKDVYKCWVCFQTNGTHGSVTKLIKKYGNNKLLDEYKLFRPEKVRQYEKKERINELPESYQSLSNISGGYHYSKAMYYLNQRSITPDIIQRYNIGVCSSGLYKDRIVIPSYDSYGDINYFVTRAYDSNNFMKYLNPEVDKTQMIFNEKLVSWDSTIYIVEGVFDHMVVPNSIPILGKFISDKLLSMLLNKASANVVVLLDDDAYNDAISLYKTLNIDELYGRVRIIKMPKGYDISLINEKYGKVGVMKLLRSAYRLKEPII